MYLLLLQEPDYVHDELEGPRSVAKSQAYVWSLAAGPVRSSGREECEQRPSPGLVVHLLPCLGVQGRCPGPQEHAVGTVGILILFVVFAQDVEGCISPAVSCKCSAGDVTQKKSHSFISSFQHVDDRTTLSQCVQQIFAVLI